MAIRRVLGWCLKWLFVPGAAKIPPVLWLTVITLITMQLGAPPQPVTAPADEPGRVIIITATPPPTPRVATPVAPTSPGGPAGTLAFSMRHAGNSDVYLLSQSSGQLLRLTFDPADDRDPAWSPDGRFLAFASRRGHGSDLYAMEMSSGTILRITRTQYYKASPSWSPDSRWVAFEGYRDGNLDIFVLDVESGEEQRLTSDAAPDYSPAWSPDGRHIAFTSYRNQNQDLYILSLDDSSITNLTQTPSQNEDYAAWSPTGEYLAFSAGVPGGETIWKIPFDTEAAARGELRPTLFGVGGKPTWSPDGQSLAFVYRQEARSYLIAVDTRGWGLMQEGYSSSDTMGRPQWRSGSLDATMEGYLGQTARADEAAGVAPLYTELLLAADTDTYGLVYLPDVNGSDRAERLSDRVNDSYNALRARIIDETQWDFLSILGDSWRPMNHTPRPGQGRISWHVCGRAIDIDQGFLRRGDVELMREDVGGVTYWRVFIKARLQDGSLGEPLRLAPWNLDARAKGGLATAQGGELKAIPAGYYVDFTTIAADYGWERRNALSNWRNSYYDIEWWHFQKTEGMSWYSCMAEIYPEDEIASSYGALPWWTKRPEWEIQSLP
ncbi:MAG: hypothetical protein MUF84_17675 [Anaerolineae bacterium]|nr:hypothetical protein [Anaerolineae bacterium]